MPRCWGSLPSHPFPSALFLLITLVPALFVGCETVSDPHIDRSREELLFESGRNAMDNDDLYAAERHFEEVLALDPGNSEAQHYLREVRKVLEE